MYQVTLILDRDGFTIPIGVVPAENEMIANGIANHWGRFAGEQLKRFPDDTLTRGVAFVSLTGTGRKPEKK